MNDMHTLIRRIFRSALFFLSGCLLVWAFLPSLKPYAAGLILGTTVSLINARILGSKIDKIAETALANTGRKANAGFVSRICMVLIGTMTALKFPQFHLAATVIGFFYVQAAAYAFGFLLNARLHKGKR